MFICYRMHHINYKQWPAHAVLVKTQKKKLKKKYDEKLSGEYLFDNFEGYVQNTRI